MSQPISLFSGYSQRENRTTNYCLLILKMLYEENPKFLAEVMSILVREDLGGVIGVKFRQQERKSASIPDGLILQSAFTIYIETKNFDWFYAKQLEKHLEALDKEAEGLKVLIALGPFDEVDVEKFAPVHKLCEEVYKTSIVFKEVSFEDLVRALDQQPLPKNLKDAIADFQAYLDEENLLPSWPRWLDVVNCAGSADDIMVKNFYTCPTTGGSYNHKRCKYFGMYRNRCVERVALIEAVVDVEDNGKTNVKWQNVPRPKNEVANLAKKKLAQWLPGQYPARVFLLGPLYPTDFRKDTSGGMFGSKQYFDVGPLNVKGSEELAGVLSGKSWSDL